VIDGGLVEFVRDLKQQPGGDIAVHGSISVAQALLAADVVDKLRLVIRPIIAGRGRLLDGCHRFSSNRSEARSHRLAIYSSSIASFVRAWNTGPRN
jgi:dihydrofolate reductase